MLGFRCQDSGFQGFRRKNSNNPQTFKSLNRYLSLPLLVSRPSSFVICPSSFVPRHLSLVICPSSFVSRHSSLVIRLSSFVSRHSSFVSRHSSLVPRHSSFVPRLSSFVSRYLDNFSVKTAPFVDFSVLKRKTSQLPFIFRFFIVYKHSFLVLFSVKINKDSFF